MLKTCTTCGLTQLTAEFYKKSDAADGLTSACKVCIRAEQNERYRRNPQPIREAAKRYRQANPDLVRAQRRANHQRHRERDNEQNRCWRERNRERHLANMRSWYRKNRLHAVVSRANRRAAMAGVAGVLTDSQVEARLAYFGGCCWMCAGPASELEHVKPMARGGLNLAANIRPSCRSCNAEKNDRWLGVLQLGQFRKVA